MSGMAPWIVILCTLAAAALSSLYLSLATVARSAVEDLARASNNPRRLERIGRIFDDVSSHARAIGLLKLVCCAGVLLGLIFWSARLRKQELPDEWDALISLGVSVAVLWVFAVLIPVGVASIAGPKVLYGWSRILRAAYIVTLPLRPIGTLTDVIISRLAGSSGKDEQEAAQDEILSVVQESVSAGTIDKHEQKMIEAVVTFGDLTVQQVMTPRTEIEAMELTSDLGEVIRTVRGIGHSRIPVYDGSLDQIVGMFYVKDLMHWLAGDGPMGRAAASAARQPTGQGVTNGNGSGSHAPNGGAIAAAPTKPKAFDLRAILRPALSVPETKTISELLRQLMEQKVHIAVAVDEHGNTAGIVTFEDIVEQIVGDIRDEYESTSPDLPDVVLVPKSNTAEINAAARVIDVNRQLEELGVGFRVLLPGNQAPGTVGARDAGPLPVAGHAETPGHGAQSGTGGPFGSSGGSIAGVSVVLAEDAGLAGRAADPLQGDLDPIAIPESEDYETVGGFIVTQLGHIPLKGERIRMSRFELEVTEAAPTRVLKARLRVL